MIIVTGSMVAREETLEELLKLSVEHVTRSRLEPGCLGHSVHQEVENPLRLVFLEHWTDREALALHFAVPASRAFVKRASGLTAGRPTMQIFEAEEVKL